MDHRPCIQTLVHDDNVLRLSASALTIGAFDGVHSGHQALIRTAVRSARTLGVPSVVYTFDPPPKALLCGVRPLTSIEYKVARISTLDPDYIIVARFDTAYRARTAADFIGEVNRLAPQVIWIGADFRFGACKSGNPDLLASYFDTKIFPAVCCEAGEIVSSTRIRALKAAGRFSEAERLEGWSSLLPVQRSHDNGGCHVYA
ncbi:FAD synthetase family protein [Rhizobium mayense]|uniref:FAD synthase n=1 Tax=Rhizobium mayense TaxID=1312184 RepID=A0ABT7JXD5_9HYPH|nr:FAD synthetase family protein [Rhizobium mayense]MDL2401008.1 FAD synthetase family protein [Rhizobium mayense]